MGNMMGEGKNSLRRTSFEERLRLAGAYAT